MRRALVLAGLLAAAMAGPAQAAFMSGQQLVKICGSGAALQHTVCASYVVGAADAVMAMERFTALPRKTCLSGGVGSNALIKAVLTHAAQAPGDARGTGADLVYTALATSYLC